MFDAGIQAVLTILSMGGAAALVLLAVALASTTGYKLIWGLFAGGSILLIFEEACLSWLSLNLGLLMIPWQTPAWLASLSVLLLAGGWLLMVPQIRKLHRERRLRQFELAKLQRITDASPLLMVTIDNEQRIRFCNRVAEQWFGVSSDDAKGMRIRELIGDEFYYAIQLQLNQALLGEAGVYTGIPVEAVDGLNRYSIHYQPVSDSLEQVLRVHLVIEDVTRQREALEGLRVAEIKMAELKTIRATSVTYAHRINSPLMGIMANAQMMADPSFGEEERKQIAEEVLEAAQDIQQATEELMNAEQHDFKPYAVGDAEIIEVGGKDSS